MRRGAVAFAIAVISTIALTGCSGSTQAEIIQTPAETACAAFYELSIIKRDSGYTISQTDLVAINKAFDTAITASVSGSDDEPLLAQLAEELDAMKTAINSSVPDMAALSAASKVAIDICLDRLAIKAPVKLSQ